MTDLSGYEQRGIKQTDSKTLQKHWAHMSFLHQQHCHITLYHSFVFLSTTSQSFSLCSFPHFLVTFSSSIIPLPSSINPAAFNYVSSSPHFTSLLLLCHNCYPSTGSLYHYCCPIIFLPIHFRENTAWFGISWGERKITALPKGTQHLHSRLVFSLCSTKGTTVIKQTKTRCEGNPTSRGQRFCQARQPGLFLQDLLRTITRGLARPNNQQDQTTSKAVDS